MKDKKTLLGYVGDLSQICGITSGELNDGKSKGVKILEVRNGSGLQFSVLPDRALDLCNLSLNGYNCSYMSKTGIVNPLYNSDNKSFFRSFFAGFMTTCGLRNVGNDCEVSGEYLGIHGRVSNLPAQEVCSFVDWDGNTPVMVIKGKIRECAFFGENLQLTRVISCRYGENKIYIHNEIENIGFRKEILMILFHFNIGYPMLDENTTLLFPSKTITPRDAEAEKGILNWAEMQKPTRNYNEQVFYHDLKSDSKGNTCVALINSQLEVAISLSFNKTQFPVFTQWKQMGQGEYVVGMEPSNCFVGGRNDPKNAGRLTCLQSFEKKSFDVTVELFSGNDNINKLIKYISKIG